MLRVIFVLRRNNLVGGYFHAPPPPTPPPLTRETNVHKKASEEGVN